MKAQMRLRSGDVIDVSIERSHLLKLEAGVSDSFIDFPMDEGLTLSVRPSDVLCVIWATASES